MTQLIVNSLFVIDIAFLCCAELMELVKDIIINLSHYHRTLNNLTHHADCNRWYGLANNGAEIKVTVNHDHGRVMFCFLMTGDCLELKLATLHWHQSNL